MEQILERIEDNFRRIYKENIRLYQTAFPPYVSGNNVWTPFESQGFFNKTLHIPYDYFMTMEQCIPVDGGYNLSAYSPCPLSQAQKTFVLHSDVKDNDFHSHDYYEMVYVYRGKRTMRVEDCTLILNEKDLCIFDTRCSHLDLRTQSNGTALYCCMTPKIADSYFIAHLTNKEIRNLFLTSGALPDDIRYLKLHASSSAAANIEAHMSSIFLEMEDGMAGFDRMAQVETLRFLNEFKQSATSDVYVLPQKLHGTKLFHAVSKYINQNIATISIDMLCNQFHYQADYYNRLIKKNTGYTYSQYVHTLKLEKAKNLLTNTDMSVQQIMLYLGYEHHSYFYKTFREATGLTPAKYREKCISDSGFKESEQKTIRKARGLV